MALDVPNVAIVKIPFVSSFLSSTKVYKSLPSSPKHRTGVLAKVMIDFNKLIF